jgi:hypothetical protein
MKTSPGDFKMTNANTKLWPSFTGVITKLTTGKGEKAEYVTLTIDCGKFRKDAIAFKEQMDTIVDLGIGARVYLRGPVETKNVTNGEGKKFNVSSMTVRTVMHKPVPAAQADEADVAPVAEVAEVVQSIPDMPEGATDTSHALYTKQDGTKAWRKRPAAQVAKLEAARTATAEVVAEAPVEAVVEAPVMEMADADDAGPETAMAAAMRRAMAG